MKLLLHFAHNLKKAHWNAPKQVTSYIKETLDYSITYYASKKLDPCGYIDSNFIEDKDTRRSTENHEFFIASGPVSKYQETIVISTVEAEYIVHSIHLYNCQKIGHIDVMIYSVGNQML